MLKNLQPVSTPVDVPNTPLPKTRLTHTLGLLRHHTPFPPCTCVQSTPPIAAGLPLQFSSVTHNPLGAWVVRGMACGGWWQQCSIALKGLVVAESHND
ncbi:hypothetical protein JZ751_020125 [Albula glossodonta]|uniref:Uncharacterized protein n=1 Tax=Albula glossodonta TaxID=121402 RepID=A0A8T2NTK5_9TELE|nr:hypothetical protein JZ751_020125 [Albula glossodonta]